MTPTADGGRLLAKRLSWTVQASQADLVMAAVQVPPSPETRPTAVGGMLVTTTVPEQRTAWTKARRDVMRIAQSLGFGTLPLPGRLVGPDWRSFLGALHRCLAPGGRILVEYPFDQRRRLYPLVAYCRLRRLRLHGLIHDLDALRFDTPLRREVAILNLFDGLISHNPCMTAWLREGGVTGPVADLGLFDYLAQGDTAWHEDELRGPVRIVCAGNLSCSKARYLYDPRWIEVAGTQVSLFGAFFEPGRMPASSPLGFRGSFDPDRPALDARYHFGLVWDGEGIAGCEGRYGHYLRFNNPHKLSLYAALGLPVVVWQDAAVAHLVRQEGIGVTVGDLRELGGLAGRVSPGGYREMARRMATLGQGVRGGTYLRRALGALACRA